MPLRRRPSPTSPANVPDRGPVRRSLNAVAARDICVGHSCRRTPRRPRAGGSRRGLDPTAGDRMLAEFAAQSKLHVRPSRRCGSPCRGEWSNEGSPAPRWRDRWAGSSNHRPVVEGAADGSPWSGIFAAQPDPDTGRAEGVADRAYGRKSPLAVGSLLVRVWLPVVVVFVHLPGSTGRLQLEHRIRCLARALVRREPSVNSAVESHDEVLLRLSRGGQIESGVTESRVGAEKIRPRVISEHPFNEFQEGSSETTAAGIHHGVLHGCLTLLPRRGVPLHELPAALPHLRRVEGFPRAIAHATKDRQVP